MYWEVVDFAKNLERALPRSGDHVSKFFKLVDPDTSISLIFYLAFLRPRKAFAMQTHIFARCSESEWEWDSDPNLFSVCKVTLRCVSVS